MPMSIINPTHWHDWSRRIPELIDALDAGFTAAEQDGLPPVGLCISLLRTQTADEATELVQLLATLRASKGRRFVDRRQRGRGRSHRAAFRRRLSPSRRRRVEADGSCRRIERRRRRARRRRIIRSGSYRPRRARHRRSGCGRAACRAPHSTWHLPELEPDAWSLSVARRASDRALAARRRSGLGQHRRSCFARRDAGG